MESFHFPFITHIAWAWPNIVLLISTTYDKCQSIM
jgi:hypothetical protein